MTREEAMYLLNNLRSVAEGKEDEALDMAIESLHREEAEEKGYCHRIRPKNVEVVVRCKDCKYWHSNTEFCDVWSFQNVAQRTLSRDYCSRGERKGGDDE